MSTNTARCALFLTCTTCRFFLYSWPHVMTIQSRKVWWTSRLLAVPCPRPAQHAFSLSWVHIIWLQSWGCEERLVVHCLLCLVHDLYSLPFILFCWIHIVTSKQIGKSDECETPQSVPYPQSAWEIFCLLTTTSRMSALAAGPTPQATWRQCYWCTVKFSW